jgi:7-cyano-7-deazaguanine synthase
MNKNAVVLLSGGLDSTTVLAIAREQGFSIRALSFDYGQRNRFELERAGHIAQHFQVAEHKTIKIDLRDFGGSSLTSESPVEKNRGIREIGVGIPSTYVPVRNTLFLSYALAWAETLPAYNIFIGVNAVDTSGYPDCRPEFISAFESLARLATKIGTEGEKEIHIHAPLQEMSKADIVAKGLSLGVDYSMTNTCYDPSEEGIACGVCDACTLRQRGFIEAGSLDPIDYQVRLD